MKVLLVEPVYRKMKSSATKGRRSDDTLWYPPLGLMKLSRFHKNRGDEVRFVSGCERSILPNLDLFNPKDIWDRVYITTLFTFNFKNTVETIKYYSEAAGGTLSKLFVGGIMASLMPEELYRATNVRPIIGILHSPSQIDLEGNEDIDLLPPDYKLLDPKIYAIRDTYYAYTTRGCINKCKWCGVPNIEPIYQDYIDIKPMIESLRKQYGDKPILKLMDNNVLPSRYLNRIVDDLYNLGYGREQFTDSKPKRVRVIDFNQGLDATFLTKERMKLLSRLNIRPMRIAFDRVQEKKQYVQALKIAHDYGVPEFSNYMLYNFKDTPRDLYKRLMINIRLNEKWSKGKLSGKIYSYPMRYAPINDHSGNGLNRKRESVVPIDIRKVNWFKNPVWTRHFTRNIEIIKGVAHGAISPTPSLARRAIGETFKEYITNLYMPEELLRNRNVHEKRVYKNEPKRNPGTGLVEKFRKFIISLLKKQNKRFHVFHNAITPNTTESIRRAIASTEDKEIKQWLKLYVREES